MYDDADDADSDCHDDQKKEKRHLDLISDSDEPVSAGRSGQRRASRRSPLVPGE
jgi:hypothetical protein